MSVAGMLRLIVRTCGVDAAVASIADAVYAEGVSGAIAAELLKSVQDSQSARPGYALVLDVPIDVAIGSNSRLSLFAVVPFVLDAPTERLVRNVASELGSESQSDALAEHGPMHAEFDAFSAQLAGGIDSLNDAAAVFEWPPAGWHAARIFYVNAAFEALFLFSAAGAIGQSSGFLHGSLTSLERLDFLSNRLQSAHEARGVIVFYRSDGVPLWVELSLREMGKTPNGAAYVVVTLRDITPLKEFERAMAKEKRKLQVTLAAIGDGVITTVADGRVDFVNSAAHMIFGIDAAEAYGHPIAGVLRLTNIAGETIDVLGVAGESPGVHRGQALFDRGSGGLKHIAYVTSLVADEGYVVVLRDVTAQHRLATQLSYEASHDSLTSIYNRRKFDEVLDDAIESARRAEGPHALAFLDLDRFKLINDACGHAVGDRVLVELAHLAQQQLRGRDVLARIGGDEFAVLLHDCSLENARRVLEKLRLAVAAYRLDCAGAEYTLGVSIGVAVIDGTESDSRAVFSRADAACYAAKTNGRNAVAG